MHEVWNFIKRFNLDANCRDSGTLRRLFKCNLLVERVGASYP